MAISDKIRLMREQCGISRKKLAEQSNCSPSLIGMLEKGNRQPTLEMLAIIKNTMGYTGVPLTDDEVDSFKRELYDFYDSIKNQQLTESRNYSNRIKLLVEKCFEDEIKILYCLFESYLLMRESDYESARGLLESIKNREDDLNEEQRYFYYYFYAANCYKDYKQSLQYFLRAEEIGRKIHKQESNLYYSISNMYARIDYSPKSIVYGRIALDLALRSQDKAYLTDIEATLAFQYSKVGFYQLSLECLYGCLKRDEVSGDVIRIGISYHNLGCVYTRMQEYSNAYKYFNKELEYCSEGDWTYLNNRLHIVYALISQSKKNEAMELINANLELSKDIPDMLMYFESAKHSLNLRNTASLAYLENITIPKLLEKGKHLKAIEYMELLSNFYEKRNGIAKSIKKSDVYAKMALSYTTKILTGEI